MIIGRKKELERMNEAYESEYSEFVAVYGRRRVGKTFLVREAFGEKFTFQHTGLANSNMRKQLSAWKSSLKEFGMEKTTIPGDWLEAFDMLKDIIRNSNEKKKVVFIDEMPWLDTKRSDFVSALEHFWNGWASARKDVLLIICGSATSWIINKIIKNHGGLHNRVTCRIHLKQFSLCECRQYAESLKLGMTNRQILECYMVMGGVPFYWSQLNRKYSLAQNIDRIFFDEDAVLINEFSELYSSLFREPETYIKVVTTLGTKRIGLTRDELISEGHIIDNGKLSQVLEDLEYCGFIRKYNQFGQKLRGAIYQLTDFYTLFYFKYILNNEHGDPQFWTKNIGTQMHSVWCGLAFERICLMHISQLKKAIGISAVQCSESAWYSDKNRRDGSDIRGAQIDLLIDRNDDIVDICEMKYYSDEVSLTEDDEAKLQNRVNRLREESETEKAVQVILVTTKGLRRNAFSDIIQNVVTMEDLFSE